MKRRNDEAEELEEETKLKQRNKEWEELIKRKEEQDLKLSKIRGHKSMRVQKILDKQNSFFKSPLTGNGSGAFGSFKLSKGNTLMR